MNCFSTKQYRRVKKLGLLGVHHIKFCNQGTLIILLDVMVSSELTILVYNILCMMFLLWCKLYFLLCLGTRLVAGLSSRTTSLVNDGTGPLNITNNLEYNLHHYFTSSTTKLIISTTQLY